MDKQDPVNSFGFVNPDRAHRAATVLEKAHELVSLTPSISKNVTSDACQDVKIDIEQKAESEVLPWIKEVERSDGIKEFRIRNCTSTSFILEFFESHDIEEELMDLTSILSVKFQFNSSFGDIGAIELSNLSKKCNKKAVLIQLVSNDGDKYSIFWKTIEIQQFLAVKPISNIEVEESKKFYEHVAEFITESFKNGHSGLISTYVCKSDSTEIEVNLLADSRDFNLLLQACEKGNALIAKISLALGMNTTLQGTKVTAQSLALQGDHYDVLLTLIEANLTFPKSFDIKKTTDEFRSVYKITELLHEHIKDNNIEKVQEILLLNPRKCYFYNFLNESAIKVALLYESMDTYELLLSQKLRFGPHEDPDALLQGLSEANKRAARDIHNRHTQDSPMKHINILLANSFICHDVDDAEAKMKFVNRAYRALNANIFIQMLLMIVAASKKFKIIFDFNRDCVSGADPTVDANTQGLFYLSGRIYVGAKQLLNEVTEHETLATMAHELCHYVMNLVYKNDAKPYIPNDNLTMQDLEEVSEKCQKMLGAEEVVDLVYECYPPESYHAELIVRVVHLLALYQNQPEKLKEVSETYSDLFEFYGKKIHPQLEEALPVIEQKAEKENEEKDEIIFKYKFMLICGGILCAILFVVGFFVMRSVFDKPTYKFADLSDSNKWKIGEAPVNYKNVSLKFIDLFPENSDAYHKLSSDHITHMLDREALVLSDPVFLFLDKIISHDWNKMADKLKHKILNSYFKFQNDILKFQKLNEKMPNVFESLTSEQIVDILDGKEMRIGKTASSFIDFYMERKFFDEDIYAIYVAFEEDGSDGEFRDYFKNFLLKNKNDYNKKISKIKNSGRFNFLASENQDNIHSIKEVQFGFEKILNDTVDSKLVIISSDGGAGKTTSFKEFAIRIKKKHSMRWVSYIDLKDFSKLYSKSGILNDPMKLLVNILSSDSKNDFEDKIIQEFVKSGDVVLLWDGFDEISPDYNEFILKVLTHFNQNTSIIQFVSTRPLYSEQLKDQFDVRGHALVPFDDGEQDEFLNTFFAKKNISKDQIPIYKEKVQNISSLLTIEGHESSFKFNSPLMLIMLGGVIADDESLYESENIYQIYEKFVKIKISDWQETELGLKFIKNISYKNKFTMFDIFQKYTVCNICHKIINLPNLRLLRHKIPKELSSEEISRTEILYINGPNNFKFAHNTFEEFFAAVFFVNYIFDDAGVDVCADDSKITADLLKFVTDGYNSNVIIIKFIKSFIKKESGSIKIQSEFSEVLRDKFNRILFSFYDLSQWNAFEFLIEMFKIDQKLLTTLLHVDDDETLYTALYSPLIYSSVDEEYLSKLKNLSEELLTKEEFEKFINGKNQRGLILFNQFYWYRTFNIKITHDSFILDEDILVSFNFSLFFDNVVRNLTESEIDVLFLTKSSAIYDFSIELLNENSMDYEIIENFMVDGGKYKIFLRNMIEYKMKMLRAYDDNFFYLTFNEVGLKLISSEIYELYITEGLLNYATTEKQFLFSWKFVKNFTNEEQQKELLKHEASGICHDEIYYAFEKCPWQPKFNAFHLVLLGKIYYEKNFDEGNSLLKIYEDYFNKTELQQMILNSDDFLYHLIFKQMRTDFQSCLGYLKKIFDGNEKSLHEYLITPVKTVKMSITEYITNYNIYDEALKIFNDFLKSLEL